MPQRTQATRMAAVATPLGDDVLLLVAAHGTEELGRPFRYDLDLLSEQPDLDFDQVVGQNVTVRVERQDGTDRYINGFVSRFEQTSADGRLAHYRATVVPWLWFLTRSADCKIFQNQTVPDIVKQVFADRGFTDVDASLSGTYPTWDYCVQYRESDFNFVQRLLEHEGIYYYFRHEDGRHTLVLCDSPAAHDPADGYADVAYRPPSGDVTTGYVTAWSLARQVEPAEYVLNDYDFTKPRTSLLNSSRVTRGDGFPSASVFDYPGAFMAPADGEEYAKVRVQELQARYEVGSAATDAVGLATGFTFALTEFPRDDQNRQYLITSTTLRVTGDAYDSTGGAASGTGSGTGAGGGRAGGNGAEQQPFVARFTAIDAQTQFRPPRMTPKPVVQGPQTAVVVGPSGEEIYTDQYGRVKVQFFWDRYGQADQNSSCWVRVSQGWAGKQWGSMFLPRIGQEVIIDFLEGDPDRPIITGRVYNGLAMPPYPLPDKMTVSGVKTNSSKGGGGFNEIRFEDKKGSEQIFVHGEKNQDVRIKNDCFEWVGHDRHLVVKNSQLEHVGLDRQETVDRDHAEKIGRDRNLTVVGKEAKDVTSTLSLKVGDDVAEEFKKNHSEQVTNDYYLKADNIVIEGMTSVTIKVGSNWIAIDAGGIKISSTGTLDTESTGPTTVKSTGPLSIQTQATGELKAMGPLTLESQAMAELKAPMATVQGEGMLTLKGGIVMIN